MLPVYTHEYAHIDAWYCREYARRHDGVWFNRLKITRDGEGKPSRWTACSADWNAKLEAGWPAEELKIGEAHFRFVGTAHDITRRLSFYPLRHTGWYSRHDQDELYVGAVWQLPSRHGKRQFVPGYLDPNNDGAAKLDLSQVGDDELEAARAADSFAERHAEQSLAYDAAWLAGSRYAQLDDRIACIRRDLLAALAERRKIEPADVPGLCRILHDKVNSMLGEIREARAERQKLRDGDFIDDAFDEGAGQKVLAS